MTSGAAQEVKNGGCRPRGSYLQYVALRRAHLEMQAAREAAGAEATLRFEKWVREGAKP